MHTMDEYSIQHEEFWHGKQYIAVFFFLIFVARERQQQIEELLKELKRVSDEAETVKAALRNLKTKVSAFA